MEAYNDWQTFGEFPYEGRLMDQPHLWKLAIDCITDAQREAQVRASWDAKEDLSEE